jgi:hypothetical protein
LNRGAPHGTGAAAGRWGRVSTEEGEVNLTRRGHLGIVAILALILVAGFVAYRFTQYGQPSSPAPGGAVQADQKPPEAYKPRPE